MTNWRVSHKKVRQKRSSTFFHTPPLSHNLTFFLSSLHNSSHTSLNTHTHCSTSTLCLSGCLGLPITRSLGRSHFSRPSDARNTTDSVCLNTHIRDSSAWFSSCFPLETCVVSPSFFLLHFVCVVFWLCLSLALYSQLQRELATNSHIRQATAMTDNSDVTANELSAWLEAYTAPVLFGGAISWFVLFSIAEFVVRGATARSGLVREASPTTPAGEKPTTVQGFAFLAISTLHSATVACLMIYCLPTVLFAGPPSGSGLAAQLRFGFFRASESELQQMETLVYIAGYTYTSWALFEVLFFTLHWRTFGKVADMLHHVLFTVTGVYFMSEAETCGFYAVVLMAMETSTPWLNIHLAFRGSGGDYRRMLGKVSVCSPQHPPTWC